MGRQGVAGCVKAGGEEWEGMSPVAPSSPVSPLAQVARWRVRKNFYAKGAKNWAPSLLWKHVLLVTNLIFSTEAHTEHHLVCCWCLESPPRVNCNFPRNVCVFNSSRNSKVLNVWNGIQVVNTHALLNSIWKGSVGSCPPINLCCYGVFISAAIKFTSLMYVLLYQRSKFCSLQKQGKSSIIKSICLVRSQCSMNNKFLLVHKGHEWAI